MYYTILAVSTSLVLAFSPQLGWAQKDSTKPQWIRNYYSEKYLDDVLKKEHVKFIPAAGVIPDSTTAISVAMLVLTKVYGKDMIESEKPFTAILRDDYWVVYGNLPSKPGELVLGGVAEIVFKKSSGEIINISHGQ